MTGCSRRSRGSVVCSFPVIAPAEAPDLTRGPTVRRRTAALAAIPLAGLALALAGCSSTLDPKSGEDLIRQVVANDRLGTLQSVSCPSGLAPKVGTAFDCKVTITPASGRTESGTITVHIVPGNKVAILGRQDLHFLTPLA